MCALCVLCLCLSLRRPFFVDQHRCACEHVRHAAACFIRAISCWLGWFAVSVPRTQPSLTQFSRRSSLPVRVDSDGAEATSATLNDTICYPLVAVVLSHTPWYVVHRMYTRELSVCMYSRAWRAPLWRPRHCVTPFFVLWRFFCRRCARVCHHAVSCHTPFACLSIFACVHFV